MPSRTSLGTNGPGDLVDSPYDQVNSNGPEVLLSAAHATDLADGERRGLESLERRLLLDFTPEISAAVVNQCMREAVAEFSGAPVRQYVPLLSERVARRRLRDLARRAS